MSSLAISRLADILRVGRRVGGGKAEQTTKTCVVEMVVVVR